MFFVRNKTMKLFELLTNEAEIPGIDILFAAIVAGVSNTTILIIINTAIQTPVTSTSHFRYLLMFAVIMVLYIISLKYTYEQITSIFEKAINNIRVRIVNKIRNCELSNLEKVGKSRLYSQINQEITRKPRKYFVDIHYHTVTNIKMFIIII